MNTTESVRNEVKALGYTPRQVSVRGRNGSVNVTIKDLSIDIKKLACVRKYERLHYCEITQEVLCGGNTFVHLSYDWEVESLAKKTLAFLHTLEEVKNKLQKIEGNSGVALTPGIAAFRSQTNGRYQLSVKWEDDAWIMLSDQVDVAWYVFLSHLQGKK